MPEQVNLSDDELRAAVAKGWLNDPAMLDKLDSDSRRRFVRVKAETSGEPTMGPTPASMTGIRGLFNRAFPAEKPRQDTAIVSGLPIVGSISPEELLGGYAAGRAVRGAVGAATTAGGKVMAGATAAAGQALPVIKYEATKAMLEKAGMPSAVAIPLALAAAGYRRGGTSPETPAAEPTLDDKIEAAVREGRLPARQSGPPIQRNALGRPIKTRPPIVTREQSGAAPIEAPESAPSTPTVSTPPVAAATPSTIPGGQVAAPSAGRAASAAPSGAGDLQLTPAELEQGVRWLQQGVAPEQILQRILQSRELTTRIGGTTPDAMRRAIDERNRTGRWPE